MFSIFQSEQKKTRRNAENWLRLAEKVYHYRYDLLEEKEVQELLGASNRLRESLRRKEDASKLKLDCEQVEEALRKYGGPYYRKSAWMDNVEVLIVAAILAIGIRTYFVQPFKIPTNSMWPSYYGMTHQIFSETDEAPGAAGRLFRRIAYGAQRHTVVAPVDGEIKLAVQISQHSRHGARLPFDVVSSRKYLIFPSQAFRYHFFVGDEPVSVDVPGDFQMGSVFHEAFFPEADSLESVIRERLNDRQIRPGDTVFIGTGIEVQKGESALEFDILTGDQLFVDRMSYHFVRPKVGDGFVFRTGKIPGLNRSDGTPDDKYYIKRLVGVGGDTLEIQEPVLLRNGEPINGQPVFQKLHEQEGLYTGYVNAGMLSAGQTVTVPENAFFAMGDNSPNSLDSRSWGFVPASEVVGRSLFIYYPFTKRWGLAE